MGKFEHDLGRGQPPHGHRIVGQQRRGDGKGQVVAEGQHDARLDQVQQADHDVQASQAGTVR
jgi:hypothetical protein